MNNKQKYLGFSLAEMMVVMLVLTIISAVALPTISKRIKKTQPTNSGSNPLICSRIVVSSFDTTLSSDVMYIQYVMYGGGGGGMGSYSIGYGGAGGSSAVLISSSLTGTPSGDINLAVAAGGAGAYMNTHQTGYDASVARGSFINTTTSSKRLTVYVGGGGGSGGNSPGSCGGSYTACYSGGGGAGYATGSSYGGPNSGANGNGATGGAGGAPANSSYGGGGGGGYGAKGGNGGSLVNYMNNGVWIYGGAYNGENGHDSPTATTSPGQGHGGAASVGGDGGSVTLMYMTTAASCPW